MVEETTRWRSKSTRLRAAPRPRMAIVSAPALICERLPEFVTGRDRTAAADLGKFADLLADLYLGVAIESARCRPR